MSDKRILIISDELQENDMLMTLLDMEGGYDVKLAPNYRAGHMLAIRGEYDLLLIDYDLGDGYGTDLIRRLRKEAAYATTPMMVSSGFSVEKESMDAGADGFLEKPYDPVDLLAMMSRLLNKC